MAAYAVRMLPGVAGVTTLGSLTIAIASWHRAHELEEQAKKFAADKESWERSMDTLRRTIDWERNMKEQAEKELTAVKGQLENRVEWSTATTLGVGIGCLVSYAMR